MSDKGLNILVCAQQVRMPGDISVTNGGHLSQIGVSYVTCEWDKYAIEEAVLLCDKHNGKVAVVAIGPERTDQLLREALAVGADEVFHIRDESLEDADDITLARALSALAADFNPDIILVGALDEDEATATIGPALARILGRPCATLVTKIEVCGTVLNITRELEGGLQELMEIDLPAVLTVQTGINEPRYPSMGRIRRAMKQDIPVLTCSDLGLGTDDVQSSRARAHIEQREIPTINVTANVLQGNTSDVVDQLLEVLKEKELLP